jgi:hypothetical protein
MLLNGGELDGARILKPETVRLMTTNSLPSDIHIAGQEAGPAFEGKILSLFEPSTEIIRKGKAGKPNEFGKMVKLQEAENQIVIDYEVYAQRPHDSELLIAAIETHEAMLGRAPRLLAADATFYSAKNEAAAKAKGVKRVCIPLDQEP